MTVKLNKDEINYIARAYLSNYTIEEISVETGVGSQNVKRALAEAGVLTLSWYKTNEENAMLEYLKQNNVTTLQELKLWV